MRLSSLEVHAFQAVGYLAHFPARWVTASEISEQTGLPRPFLLRALSQLVAGDVVRSKHGPSGGYRLARTPQSTTLREVVAALERPVAPLSCVSLSSPAACTHEHCCGIRRSVYQEVRDATHAVLERFTAADLARDLSAGVLYRSCLSHLWHPQVESRPLPPVHQP